MFVCRCKKAGKRWGAETLKKERAAAGAKWLKKVFLVMFWGNNFLSLALLALAQEKYEKKVQPTSFPEQADIRAEELLLQRDLNNDSFPPS